jgi:hypothetical protein
MMYKRLILEILCTYFELLKITNVPKKLSLNGQEFILFIILIKWNPNLVLTPQQIIKADKWSNLHIQTPLGFNRVKNKYFFL